MTHWKSYRLLSESFADIDEEAPATLFRRSVERVVDGLVDHAAYSTSVALAASRRGALQCAQRRMVRLIALDANPLAELLRAAPDARVFEARWNGFNRMAPLGVVTRLACDDGVRLARETRAAGLCDELRSEASTFCIEQLMPKSGALPDPRRTPAGMAARRPKPRGAAGQRRLPLRPSVRGARRVRRCARLRAPYAAARARASGLSFRLLRQAVRLTIAGHAMRTGGNAVSLTTIAHDAGFFDSAHFVRAWKQSCGLTPSQYRSLC